MSEQTTHLEPSDITRILKLDGIPDAEFTPYDGAGWEYIIDLPGQRQAFKVTVEPYEWIGADDD